MVKIIDGKALAAAVRAEVATDVAAIKADGGRICFAAVLVGDDPASQIYVRNKQKACEKAGIEFTLHTLAGNCQQRQIVALLKKLSQDKTVNGILLQLPLPATVVGRDEMAAINAIDPQKDVDGLTNVNLGKLANRTADLVPCTAQGVVHAITSVCPDLTGRNVVMIGRSRIVGRPTALLLENLNATVTVCHRSTRDLTEHTKRADIIVVAAGHPNLLTAKMVSRGAIVIDVGINRLPDGHLVGDVDFANVAKKAAAITPVPGGIGPLTIAFLLRNVVTAYRGQHSLQNH